MKNLNVELLVIICIGHYLHTCIFYYKNEAYNQWEDFGKKNKNKSVQQPADSNLQSLEASSAIRVVGNDESMDLQKKGDGFQAVVVSPLWCQ